MRHYRLSKSGCSPLVLLEGSVPIVKEYPEYNFETELWAYVML
jgi:hypothetical protein